MSSYSKNFINFDNILLKTATFVYVLRTINVIENGLVIMHVAPSSCWYLLWEPESDCPS